MSDLQVPTPPDDRHPIAAAARIAGVPERSLFRAVEKGVVPSTRRDGIAVVFTSDVQVWADRRAARQAEQATASTPATPPAATPLAHTAAVMLGSLPAAHGSVAGGGGRGGIGAVLDGDLAATLFEAYEAGDTPVALVQRLRIPPGVALAAHRQYLELKSAGGHRDSAGDRLDQMGLQLHLIQETQDSILTGGTVPTSVAELRQVVDQVVAYVRTLTPPRT
jgi:hypothetical protein